MSRLSLISTRWRKFPDGTLRQHGRPNLGTVVVVDPNPHGHAEITGLSGFASGGVVIPPEPPSGTRNASAGAIPPGQQTDPVPTTGVIRYVEPIAGSDSNTGLVGAPYKTIQRAINAVGAGATIVLRAGVYNEGGAPGVQGDLGVSVTEGTVGQRANLTIMAYPLEEVWMDGTAPLTGWATSAIKPGTNVWRAPYTYTFDRSVQFARGSVDGTTAGYIWLNASDARGKIANIYDQLFAVNASGVRTPWVPVATSGELGPGKFWLEGTVTGGTGVDRNLFHPTAVYIGTDPASVTQIRASNKVAAFNSVADGCTIQGFGVRGYATGNADGGTVEFRRNGCTAQDITIIDSAGVGFSTFLGTRVGPSTLRRVTIQRSGLNCVHVEKGNGFYIYDSLFERSNTHNWNMAPAAGGIKITSTIGVRAYRSKFNNHNGDGFWCDASVFDTDVISCDAQNNAGHGFEYEISAKARFVDCLSTANGKDCFLNRCSDEVEFWYCTGTGAAEVIMDATQDNRATAAGPVSGVFGQDTRYSGKDDPVYGSTGMYWWVTKYTVQNCVIVKPSITASGGALRIRTQGISRTIADYGPVVNGNLYSRISGTAPVTGWVLITTGYPSFAAYRTAASTGGVSMDANGISIDGHDVLNGDYSLKTADEAAALAVVPGMTAPIAALLGRPVGTKHIGAFL